MPGAWEIPQAKVVGVVIHTEMTTIAWANGFRNLALPSSASNFVFPSGMPYDHARNVGTMAALDQGATHVFHFDSDIIPPPDAVLRLLARDLPVVSGMYCRRSPPHGIPVAIKDGQWVTQFKPGALVPVDYVGAGCLLIKTDVLRELKPQTHGKHWFRWAVDLKGGDMPDNECMSEDFTFCAAVKKQLGIQVYLDTSVMCRHVGLSQVLPGTMEPLGI